MIKLWLMILFIYIGLVLFAALFSVVVYFRNKDKPFVYKIDETDLEENLKK